MSATFIPVNLSSSVALSDPRIKDLPEFNVSNSNAADILASLGLEPAFECASPYLLEQVEAECVTFLRIAAGTEVDQQVNSRQVGNLIHCGRREGYTSHRVTQLLEVVRLGLTHGGTHLQVG